MDLQLTPMKLLSSFRFLGVWFNLQGSPSFVISQIKDIYKAFVSTVRFKKLAPNQLAYLHSALDHISVYRRSCSPFPRLAFSSPLFNDDTNPYTYLCQRLISRLMAWISLYTSGSVYSEWVVISFRTLQQVLKWPSSLDQISDFSKWNSSRRSIHHNWIFQTLRILSESGLKLTLPNDLCLDLMPSHSIPLVTLSSELANSEKATWLFSKLWCFSQLVDPFNQFLLLAVTIPIQYPSFVLMLQNTALATIDEQSHIKARNRYYWIAGLDGSNSLIFGRVFYTVDVHGTRIVYFSHWVNSLANGSIISPCQGCSLHDGTIEDGPLQDILSFKFLVDLSSHSLPNDAIVSLQLPVILPDSDLDIRLGTEHHIYLHAKCLKPCPISSKDVPCGWVQKDESLILASGIFHGLMVLLHHKPLN
ncbi:hypothetical protein RhiirA4_478087 [Rhizophagus irregularis]|uniref:Uncharacterized protein n=1 Tax=Rhizophagus irregularis TaxID=588596 RepID=A0A2I1HE85_9GLOM|nr:hypothetical protein RhiirA4_478087 [Rhizophagus irregularis]